MEKSTVAVFTSPTCPFCPAAKQLAQEIARERADVEYREFNSATPEGQRESARYGIQSVPTIFVRGPKHPEILAFQGTPSKKRLLHAINITQGMAAIEEPRGFLDRVKGMFG